MEEVPHEDSTQLSKTLVTTMRELFTATLFDPKWHVETHHRLLIDDQAVHYREAPAESALSPLRVNSELGL